MIYSTCEYVCRFYGNTYVCRFYLRDLKYSPWLEPQALGTYAAQWDSHARGSESLSSETNELWPHHECLKPPYILLSAGDPRTEILRGNSTINL